MLLHQHLKELRLQLEDAKDGEFFGQGLCRVLFCHAAFRNL